MKFRSAWSLTEQRVITNTQTIMIEIIPVQGSESLLLTISFTPLTEGFSVVNGDHTFLPSHPRFPGNPKVSIDIYNIYEWYISLSVLGQEGMAMEFFSLANLTLVWRNLKRVFLGFFEPDSVMTRLAFIICSQNFQSSRWLSPFLLSSQQPFPDMKVK